MHRSHAAFLDLRDILLILRRQRWLVALTCLVMLTVAGAYLLRTTALFTATALVQIDPQETNLLDPSAGHSGTPGAEDARIETEVEILKSPRLALQTIKTADLSNSAAFGPRVGPLDQFRLALGVTLPTPSATALLNETIANSQRRWRCSAGGRPIWSVFRSPVRIPIWRRTSPTPTPVFTSGSAEQPQAIGCGLGRGASRRIGQSGGAVGGEQCGPTRVCIGKH